MDALNVLPPEVGGNDEAESGGEEVGGDAALHVQHLSHLIEEATEVLAGGDAADGAGEDVVEDEGGNGQAGHEGSHRVTDNNVDAAPDEHAAAFHIDGADREAEQHDGEDKPGCAGTDGLFRDTTGIEGRRGKIAEDNGGTAPEGDEGEGDC